MPEKEIAARAKRWRTVKLPNGKSIRVAIVKKAAPGGAVQTRKPVGGSVENLRMAVKKGK